MNQVSSKNKDRLKLALSQWQQWHSGLTNQPTATKQLGHGLTNKSYLISSNMGLWVIRLNNENSASLGINRPLEKYIMEQLALYNFTPRPVYFDPEYRYVVSQYIAGRQWTLEDFEDPEKHNQLNKVIDQYQRLEEPTHNQHRYNYRAQLQHLWCQVPNKNKQLQQQWRDFSVTMCAHETKEQHQTNGILCHHDLNPSNIIENNQGIWIIDWEYAGFGLSDFDKRYVQSQINKPMLQQDFISELIFWLNRLWNLIR